MKGGRFGYQNKIATDGSKYPGAIVLENARDLAELVFEGYSDTPPLETKPIAIYTILNAVNSYIVCCSGTEATWSFTVGLPADIAASLGQTWGFPNSVVKAIRDHVPKGALLLFAGHSLGGMSLQNAILTGLEPDYELNVLTAYGCPRLYPFILTTPQTLFATALDPVPLLTGPITTVTTFPSSGLTIVLAPGVPLDPASQHLCYPFLKSLEAYPVTGKFDKLPLTLYVQLLYTVFPQFP